MTPLPTPSLKSPEEMAKEIINTIRQFDDCEYRLEEAEKVIKLDRSRIIQYIREKMPKPYGTMAYCDAENKDEINHFEGWNSALEAVEKILEGMK